MEIEQFDTKYELHTISEFVKCLNSKEESMNEQQNEAYIFNKISQKINNKDKDEDENEYCVCESKNSESNEPHRYTVIKYDKKKLPKNKYSSWGLIRSLIINASNKVVSFSPPKCISYEEFVEKNPSYNDNIIIEELIEGTMIQLFWDSYECKWEIATKSSIGGYNTNTFTKTTFRDMFFDALKEMGLTLNDFNHKYCYSFVLQHPKNQIVFDIVKPQLYLLYVYSINHILNISHDSGDSGHDSTDNIKEEIEIQVCHLFDSHVNKNNPSILPKECKIKYPKQISIKEQKTYNQLYDYFYTNSYDIKMNYSTMGLVIYNSLTGERCKIRNPYYEHIHNIHGRQSKLLYKYLIARSLNTVKHFMSFYQNDPEIKNKIESFKTKIQSFTNILLIHYIDCFINKTKPLSNYPPEYKSHMYNLHNMYLQELKPNKRNVNLIETIYYVKNLHPSKLVYSLITKTKK